MEFLNTLPDNFMGCDPDMKNAAYALVNKEGNVVKAYTISSTNNLQDQAEKHKRSMEDKDGTNWHPYVRNSVAAIEGQMIYQNDRKSNPEALIKLARSSGVSASYMERLGVSHLQVVLPSVWKGTRQKHAHQADILRRLGQEPIIRGKGEHRYAVPADNFLNLNMTQYKHVIDAIGIALWLRDAYVWEFKKRSRL